MKRSTQFKVGLAIIAGAIGMALPSTASAEIKLAEADGWVVSTDGRVNAFVSHVFGENRPASLKGLPWVGFNETGASGQSDSENRLRKTRVRSGYVPTTVAFNFRKQLSDSLEVSSRVELGIQIANTKPTEIADPTWMEPRAAYLNITGNWGSVRAGRDLGLFGRHNLFLNYELGHGYGLGFPCAYESVFGGSCGHVGFGVIWPDFKPQITYTTPSIGGFLEISAGVFDPRSFPPADWHWTPLPRFESEAVASFGGEDLALKLWANGFYQKIGTTQNVDALDANGVVIRVPQDFEQDLLAVGGGAKADLGPFQVGVTGHTGKGLDSFVLLTFNPVALSLGPVPNQDKKFRNVSAFLAHVAYHLGDSWLSLGYGKSILHRVEGDLPEDAVDQSPRPSEQTGMSVGLYHRIDQIVLGLDYFNADYGFDANFETDPASGNIVIREAGQNVNIINGGVTLEW